LEKEKVEGQKLGLDVTERVAKETKSCYNFVLPTTRCTIVVQKLPHFARGLGGGGEEFFIAFCSLKKEEKKISLPPPPMIW
jgi:hypothetical protein